MTERRHTTLIERDQRPLLRQESPQARDDVSAGERVGGVGTIRRDRLFHRLQGPLLVKRREGHHGMDSHMHAVRDARLGARP